MSHSLPVLPAPELFEAARGAGFQGAGLIAGQALPARLAAHSQLAIAGEGCYLMVALSCFRREAADLSVRGDPHALIAPFSRRNYYREAVSRLKALVRLLADRVNLDRRRARIFCNSRLPEKPLAAVSGMGFMGKNCLMIVPGLGSLFVIAGVFLPVRTAGAPPPGSHSTGPPRSPAGAGPFERCGACRACQDACPVGALARAGRLDEKLCLQAQAAKALPFSAKTREAWGNRLYGCQSCQESCPYNRGLSQESEVSLGELGPSLSIRRLLRLGPDGLKALFRGTPMGMSWIAPRAILRNALVAAGHSGESSLRPQLRPYREGIDPLLREAAEWSDGRLGRAPERAVR